MKKYLLKECNTDKFILHIFSQQLDTNSKIQLCLSVKSSNGVRILSNENTKWYKVVSSAEIIDKSLDRDIADNMFQCNSEIPVKFLSEDIQNIIKNSYSIPPLTVGICDYYPDYLFLFIYGNGWDRLNLKK